MSDFFIFDFTPLFSMITLFLSFFSFFCDPVLSLVRNSSFTLRSVILKCIHWRSHEKQLGVLCSYLQMHLNYGIKYASTGASAHCCELDWLAEAERYQLILQLFTCCSFTFSLDNGSYLYLSPVACLGTCRIWSCGTESYQPKVYGYICISLFWTTFLFFCHHLLVMFGSADH